MSSMMCPHCGLVSWAASACKGCGQPLSGAQGDWQAAGDVRAAASRSTSYGQVDTRAQTAGLAIASLVVIGLIVAFHGQSERSLYLSVALGLLLGGAIGNMIDRLRLGYVVDFVDIGIGGFRWYTFNLADAAISGALVMLFALAFIPKLTRLGE